MFTYGPSDTSYKSVGHPNYMVMYNLIYRRQNSLVFRALTVGEY
jgi:hypothetical protein